VAPRPIHPPTRQKSGIPLSLSLSLSPAHLSPLRAAPSTRPFPHQGYIVLLSLPTHLHNVSLLEGDLLQELIHRNPRLERSLRSLPLEPLELRGPRDPPHEGRPLGDNVTVLL